MNGGSMPSNIKTQTWFSFLIEHGVRPFQSLILDGDIHGMELTNEPSGLRYRDESFDPPRPIYFGAETHSKQHYLNSERDIYSDKLAKFVATAEAKSKGEISKRLSLIYKYIFIDEVQDLAGHDLTLLRAFSKTIENFLLAGDPRQVTYLTNHPKANKDFRNGNIRGFLEKKQYKKQPFKFDTVTLRDSHRNCKEICDFASLLYPFLLASEPCKCKKCDSQKDKSQRGIYFIAPIDIEPYLKERKAIQLRWDRTKEVSSATAVYNFGESKGLTFDHVLIYPTKGMKAWLVDNTQALADETRAKLYVAITRSRSSVAFVM